MVGREKGKMRGLRKRERERERKGEKVMVRVE